MTIALYIAWALLVASVGYMIVASYCVIKFSRRLALPSTSEQERPSVTIYKPLHGLDFELKRNLISFCKQDYPKFEIIFGVTDFNDPAIPVVREVMAEFPHIQTNLLINSRGNGLNPKISNLINMDTVARNELLVISDSDMRVEPDYLERVVAEFDSGRVGLTTCLYKGTPAPGLMSKLGALFINQWFAPSALIPSTFGGTQHCFGATMAIKRQVLDEIGGFQALVGNLADDYTLGRLVHEAGYEVRLADFVVENMVDEPDLKTLFLHELRWARTIRSVEPLAYLMTFITDTIPLGLIAGLAAYFAHLEWGWVLAPVALAISAKAILYFSTRAPFSSSARVPIWVHLLRDLLSFGVRIACYAGRTVNWRNSQLSVISGGQISGPAPNVRVIDEYKKDVVPESSLL